MKESKSQNYFTALLSRKTNSAQMSSSKVAFESANSNRLALELEQARDTIIKLKNDLALRLKEISLLKVVKQKREDDLQRTNKIVEEIIKQSDLTTVHAMSMLSRSIENNELPPVNTQIRLSSEQKTRMAEIVQINELKKKINEQNDQLETQKEEIKALKDNQKVPNFIKLNNFMSSYNEYNSIRKENEAIRVEFEKMNLESEIQKEHNIDLYKRLKNFSCEYKEYKTRYGEKYKKMESSLIKAKEKEQTCKLFHQRKASALREKNNKTQDTQLNEMNAVSSRSDQLLQAEIEMQKLQKKLFEMTNENEASVEALNKLKEEFKAVEKERNKLKKDNGELTQKKGDLTMKVNMLEEAEKKLKDEVSRLRSQMTNSNKSSDEKEVMLNEKDRLIREMMKKAEETEAEKLHLNEMIQELNNKVTEYEARCDEDKAKVDVLQELVDENQMKSDILTQELNEERVKNYQLNEEISALNKRIEELLEMINKKKDEELPKNNDGGFFSTQLRMEEFDIRRKESDEEDNEGKENKLQEHIEKEELLSNKPSLKDIEGIEGLEGINDRQTKEINQENRKAEDKVINEKEDVNEPKTNKSKSNESKEIGKSLSKSSSERYEPFINEVDIKEEKGVFKDKEDKESNKSKKSIQADEKLVLLNELIRDQPKENIIKADEELNVNKPKDNVQSIQNDLPSESISHKISKDEIEKIQPDNQIMYENPDNHQSEVIQPKEDELRLQLQQASFADRIENIHPSCQENKAESSKHLLDNSQSIKSSKEPEQIKQSQSHNVESHHSSNKDLNKSRSNKQTTDKLKSALKTESKQSLKELKEIIEPQYDQEVISKQQSNKAESIKIVSSQKKNDKAECSLKEAKDPSKPPKSISKKSSMIESIDKEFPKNKEGRVDIEACIEKLEEDLKANSRPQSIKAKDQNDSKAIEQLEGYLQTKSNRTHQDNNNKSMSEKMKGSAGKKEKESIVARSKHDSLIESYHAKSKKSELKQEIDHRTASKKSSMKLMKSSSMKHIDKEFEQKEVQSKPQSHKEESSFPMNNSIKEQENSIKAVSKKDSSKNSSNVLQEERATANPEGIKKTESSKKEKEQIKTELKKELVVEINDSINTELPQMLRTQSKKESLKESSEIIITETDKEPEQQHKQSQSHSKKDASMNNPDNKSISPKDSVKEATPKQRQQIKQSINLSAQIVTIQSKAITGINNINELNKTQSDKQQALERNGSNDIEQVEAMKASIKEEGQARISQTQSNHPSKDNNEYFEDFNETPIEKEDTPRMINDNQGSNEFYYQNKEEAGSVKEIEKVNREVEFYNMHPDNLKQVEDLINDNEDNTDNILPMSKRDQSSSHNEEKAASGSHPQSNHESQKQQSDRLKNSNEFENISENDLNESHLVKTDNNKNTTSHLGERPYSHINPIEPPEEKHSDSNNKESPNEEDQSKSKEGEEHEEGGEAAEEEEEKVISQPNRLESHQNKPDDLNFGREESLISDQSISNQKLRFPFKDNGSHQESHSDMNKNGARSMSSDKEKDNKEPIAYSADNYNENEFDVDGNKEENKSNVSGSNNKGDISSQRSQKTY